MASTRIATMAPAPDRVLSRPSRPAYVALAAGTLVGASALAVLQSLGLKADSSFNVLSAAALSLHMGVVVFLLDGRHRITAVGTYFLACGIFIGGALLLLRQVDTHLVSPIVPRLTPQVANAALLATGLQSLTLLVLAVCGVAGCIDRVGEVQRPSPSPFLLTATAGLTALFGLAGLAGLYPGPLARRSVAACVVLFFALAGNTGRSIVSGSRLRTLSFGFIALLVFLQLFFTGDGRLLIASLLLASLIAFGFLRPRRWHKLVVLAAVAPALVVFSAIGASRREDGTADAVEGLYSVYSPLSLYAYSLYQDEDEGDRLGPLHGSTYAGAAVFWVPRAAWSGKPVGFGRTLAEHFAPDVTGLSLAALDQGEFLANFGRRSMLLFPICPLVLLWSITRVHRWLLVNRSPKWHLYVAALAISAASLSDFMWVGSFEYLGRAATSVAFLIGLGFGARGLTKSQL